jgi:hypothetical protein
MQTRPRPSKSEERDSRGRQYWITITLVAWVFCYGAFIAMLLRSAAATSTMRDRADENRDR